MAAPRPRCARKYGLQTDFKTRLDGLGLGLERGLLLWGFDINRDTTEQPLLPLTPIDGRTFAPPMLTFAAGRPPLDRS